MRLRIKDLQLDARCYTKLHIRDGNSWSSGLLKSTCDWSFSHEDSMFSSGRSLWVQFNSPHIYGRRYSSKFDAVFEAVKHGKILL